MILDRNQLIATKDGFGQIDGGDTLAETGRIYFLKNFIQSLLKTDLPSSANLLPEFSRISNKLVNESGELIRNPIQWNDPKDVSRDQADPFIQHLVFSGNSAWLNILYTDLKKKKFRYPNGDVASPEHIGHFFRHKKKWWKWLYFHFSDLFMLLNSLIICYSYGKEQAAVANDLNHMMSLLNAEIFYPTFISRLAARIYFKKRPIHPFKLVPIPNLDMNSAPVVNFLASKATSGWEYALKQYYTLTTGNEDLIEYYTIAMNWLKGKVL
jgi:hypothetical protein